MEYLILITSEYSNLYITFYNALLFLQNTILILFITVYFYLLLFENKLVLMICVKFIGNILKMQGLNFVKYLNGTYLYLRKMVTIYF